MAGAVEYQRALNAVKLERVFAKPFVGSLHGHSDGLTCMAKSPFRLNCLVSGASDGEIRVWDVAQKAMVRQLLGHSGAVAGVCVAPHGDACVSAGADSTVRLWRIQEEETDIGGKQQQPQQVYEGQHAFRGVDHHYQKELFVTAGPSVQVWDHNRSEPVSSFTWGSDSVTSVRCNPAEVEVLATSGSDRSVCLYDLRMGTPTRKLVMMNKTNAICWNPREPLNFTIANEDCNLYSYDMRKLDMAKCVHEDFVSAVMDVDFSPTGQEFVAGSYDRTVRIFPHTSGHSREVYHTKRMQRVFCVKFSNDGGYVLSGSEDMNVRIWKAHASQQLGTMLPRERQKAAYSQALVGRYRHLSEVKRIERHRHVPKPVVKAHRTRRDMLDSEARRKRQRQAHATPGTLATPPARKAKIVNVLE
eukprot:CAMPEP_0196594724 /NCGR_PEP_ID=MMETSP1081-20130531/79099_1 /TAXON_ID=36882 /ORGANISM="Pyramimonas amylifera, Strain CCMP720" /LENGTH=414 /DNA_ID=CAMNT_0041919065 /DNA_START=210 /DNA_END=1454 /DNA_ORIENTATION=-